VVKLEFIELKFCTILHHFAQSWDRQQKTEGLMSCPDLDFLLLGAGLVFCLGQKRANAKRKIYLIDRIEFISPSNTSIA
jgi:hypothetical protein